MAKRDGANLRAPARAVLIEKATPGPLAQPRCVRLVLYHQENPIFIEQSYPIAQAPAGSANAVPRNLGRLKLMQDRLDPRKTQPNQGIEKIVEGAWPTDSGWNRANRRDRLLVGHLERLGLGNKA